jgi:8-oxo-dGTP pyrophosphatase MutT (NUDIX family)
VASTASITFDRTLRARIAQNLQAHTRHQIDTESLRPAAVALALLGNSEQEACFLLTRRASTLAHHRGQFALPGGRLDPGESQAEAALRELREELGVRLDSADVLGQLDDFKTRSGFVISPVVMWAEGELSLVPNPAEVARVYRVPLADLYQPEVPRLSPAGGGATILSLPLVGTEVFSPTAAIIYQLREVAIEGRATRVHHYEQPRFAWK